MWAIAKKEFKSYFLSPIGYIYIGIFLLMTSVFFYLDVFAYGQVEFAGVFGSVSTVLTFIVPLLTMRLFAEERKTGTEQILLTSPKSVTQIVMGKFIGVSMVTLVATALTLTYYAILCVFGQPHVQTALVAILGFELLSIAYAAFGMFASSLSENQIVAAVISIGFFLLSWFLPNIVTATSPYSLMNAFYSSFMNGTVSVQDTTLLISFSALFVIFTIMTIQRRKNVK